MVAEFDPGELTSEYRSQLRELLEAKLEGREPTVPEPVEDAPVVDLMEALQAERRRGEGPQAGSVEARGEAEVAPARARQGLVEPSDASGGWRRPRADPCESVARA